MNEGSRAAGLLLLILALNGCSWWSGWRSAEPPPVSAPEPAESQPAPAASPAAPRPQASPAASASPAGDPVIRMQRDAEGVYVVTVEPDSGLPVLAAGASRAQFERQVEELGARIIEERAQGIEVVPGGDFADQDLPMRILYQFDANARFVRVIGEF